MEVRAVEACLAIFAGGRVDGADDGEDRQRNEHGNGEEVLDETEGAPPANEGDHELLVEEVSVGLEDGEQQDGESPEDEGVGEPRDRPLEQLLLSAHFDQLGLDAGGDIPDSTWVGASRAHQASEEVEAPARNGGGEDGDDQANDNPDGQR